MSNNYDEIVDIVEQKLAPTFAMLGNMLKEIDEKAEVGVKLAGAFSDMVGGHKKNGITGRVKEKFGPDLDVIDEYFKDNFDKSYSEELINSLMDNEGNISDIDAYAGNMINDVKGKYGKYMRFPEHEAEETPEEEEAEHAEEMTPGDFMEQEGGPEVEEEEEEDPTGGMMKMLGIKMKKIGG